MLERYRSAGQLEPLRLFRDFQREVNRLFSDFFGTVGEWASYPPMAMIETKDDIIVVAELPGLEKGDFKLTLTDNTLTISGERKEEQLPEGARYLFNERIAGRFARSLTLPTLVDKDRVRAEFKNGLLRVTLPKHEETKPKEIEIR
ncbi:MAG: Hsp20/alpha crystallin family protein [candidate division KSB1 bacterium]|nr:Hsp20/alpha crystallin family protein [candidate division KSB1 bacterium]